MVTPRRTLRSTPAFGPLLAAAALTAMTATGLGMATAASAADAARSDVHTVNVLLPDGAVAQVSYRGAVAPRVVVVPQAVAGLPVAFANPFAVDPMFAAMERERVAMLRQMDEMRAVALRQAALNRAGAAAAGAPMVIRTGTLLPGSSFHYSFVSTTSGPRGCTRTVEWRSDGTSKEPQVVRASSGDCDAASSTRNSKALTPTAGPAPAGPNVVRAPAAPARVQKAPPGVGIAT